MQFLEKLCKMRENIKISSYNDRRRNYLVSEPNYHTTKKISKDLLVVETKKKHGYFEYVFTGIQFYTESQ